MSKRLIVFKNVEGRMLSTSSYQDEEEDSDSEGKPGLVMYECLRSMIRKQQMYPFQLLKQFILFSSEESSIEVDYKYMRGDLEMVQFNILSVCDLYRQKLLVHGFLTVKHAYQKQQRVDEAYYNEENLEQIQGSMLTVQIAKTRFLKWNFFGRLYEYRNAKYEEGMKMREETYNNYQNLELIEESIRVVTQSRHRLLIFQAFGTLRQNLRSFKLSKISLSKIEVTNNDFPSKQFDQFHQFLNQKQTGQIQEINSFIIEKQCENIEEALGPHSDTERELHYEGLKIEKRSNVKSYQYKNDKLTSEKSMINNTPSINNTKDRGVERESEEFEHRILVTQRKEADIPEPGSTHRHHKDQGKVQTQHIYLIRDSSKKKGPPTSYIKIPLTTQNVKIVEIQTERKKRKREVIEQRVTMSEKQCQNCRFCQMERERREIMKRVQDRLLSFQNYNINVYKQPSHHSLDEDNELSYRGNRSGYYEHRVTQFRHDVHGGGDQAVQSVVAHYNPGTVLSQRVDREEIVSSEANGGKVLSTNIENYSNTRSSSFSHVGSKGLNYQKATHFLGK